MQRATRAANAFGVKKRLVRGYFGVGAAGCREPRSSRGTSGTPPPSGKVHARASVRPITFREFEDLPQTVLATATGQAQRAKVKADAGSVLCVANFPANTGYAWDFIESLYAGIADQLSAKSIPVWVGYPEVQEYPKTLIGSAAKPVELEVRPGSPGSMSRTLRFIRKHDVQVVYVADQPAWHPAYALMKLAGVRRVIAHDHTSGARTVPQGVKRFMKLALRRAFSFMFADVVLAVSDFVAQRKVEVELVPQQRVRRIWNSVVVPPVNARAKQRLREAFSLNAGEVVVMCACRAAREKGVEHLLKAVDRIEQPAVVIYMGQGPDIGRLEEIRLSSGRKDQIIFAGYREDAKSLMEGADICVVPSVWQEAFGLSVLEPMARGVPVIATRVGGIPEVVVEGETGLLVQPGDEVALARALDQLLANPVERQRMGDNGRRRALEHFSLNREIDELTRLVESGLA